MAIAIKDSDTMQGGYNASHTLPDIDASGTNSFAIACGFNRNPASDVSSWTFEGNTPSNTVDKINANVCAVSIKHYIINNSATTIVSNTPSYKLQAIIGIALTGVHQTNPIAGTGTAGVYGTSISVTYTGTSGNLLLVFIALKSDYAITPSNCTELYDFAHSDANLGQCFAGYVSATGSSQTVGGSWSTSDNAEMAVVEVAAVAGVAYTKDIDDSVVVSDSLSKAISVNMSETVHISEGRSLAIGKNISDDVNISDSAGLSIGKNMADTVSVTDETIKDIAKNISDTVNVEDSHSTVAEYNRTFVEGVIVSDNVVKDVIKNISDTVTIQDNTKNSVGKNIADIINVSDELTKAVGKNIDETVIASDAVDKIVGKNINDSVLVSDEVDPTKAVIQSIADTVQIVDSLSKTIGKNIFDTVNTSDTLKQEYRKKY